VLPPVADPSVSGRADPSIRLGTDHSRDRGRLPRARTHDGATAVPGPRDLAASGARFRLPCEDTLPEWVAALLDVLHLIFNEGYTRTAGEMLLDTSLTGRRSASPDSCSRSCPPDHDEVAGVLALMLLTQSRHAARSNERGDLIPLAEQDRGLWDRSLIFEGVAILEQVLPRGHVGRFQLQAAIAAVHAEAATWEDTDWLQITMLYEMLERIAPSPAVTLNRAVAVAMSLGPEHGLAVLDPLLENPTTQRHHRTHAVRAHLLEMLGQRAAAADGYQRAAPADDQPARAAVPPRAGPTPGRSPASPH
jgi:predicted RNA polymerase sigma factor